MDEAGRGPAIGPLVIGLVVISEEQESYLKEVGVNDSKVLSKQKRESLANEIKNNSTFHNICIISAGQIDQERLHGKSLNEIEVVYFRKLLQTNKLDLKYLQLDAADVNVNRFGSNFIDLTPGRIISEHKADAKYVSVAAASIIAKVTRDQIVGEFQAQVNKSDPDLPPIGSGYPTEAKPFLVAFIKKYGHLPEFARSTWETSEKALEEVYGPKQSNLEDFY